MNKIIINDNISFNLDDKITLEQNEDLINKIKITIKENTKLEIYFKDCNKKYDIKIKILENVKLSLTEIKINCNTKLLFKYELSENSILDIIKINDVETINERNYINLNGMNAKVNNLLKTVGKNSEKYDFIINHNFPKTISDITTNGLNISGNMYFNITTCILKGMKNCVANQNNRIINLTNNECTIRPNLLIDEVDVIANHSALIGTFKDEELFYMQRLGLSIDKASKLLIEGFIKNKINNKLANYFKKYWR